MKEVIRIPESTPIVEEKPVEFTHIKGSRGWESVRAGKINFLHKIVYLGKCRSDGDMFAGYYDNIISVFKGHLNSGKY